MIILVRGIPENENAIQEKRPDIQSALKAMNWERRLKEARALRKELLASRQSDPGTSGIDVAPPVKVEAAESRADSAVKNVPQSVVFPRIEKRTGPVAADKTMPVPDRAETLAANISTVRTHNRVGVKRLLALGFGIGLGISFAVIWNTSKLGGSFEHPVVANAPDAVDFPSQYKSKIPLGYGRGFSSTGEMTAIFKDFVVVDAPELGAGAPAPLSHIEYAAAEYHLPSPMEPKTSQDRSAPILVSPSSSETQLPARTPSPRLPFLQPRIGSATVTDESAFGELSTRQLSNWPPIAALSSELIWRSPQKEWPVAATDSDLTDQRSPVILALPPSENLAFRRPERVAESISDEEITILSPYLHRRIEDGHDATLNDPPPTATSGPGSLRIPGAQEYTVRLQAPTKTSAELVESYAESLRGTGVSLSPIRRVAFKVSATHVRFFHAHDAPAAKEIADHIGAEVRDFTSYRPSPQIGSIEVFIAGDGSPSAPRKLRNSRQEPTKLGGLLNRIVDGLRRGNFN